MCVHTHTQQMHMHTCTHTHAHTHTQRVPFMHAPLNITYIHSATVYAHVLVNLWNIARHPWSHRRHTWGHDCIMQSTCVLVNFDLATCIIYCILTHECSVCHPFATVHGTADTCTCTHTNGGTHMQCRHILYIALLYNYNIFHDLIII